VTVSAYPSPSNPRSEARIQPATSLSALVETQGPAPAATSTAGARRVFSLGRYAALGAFSAALAVTLASSFGSLAPQGGSATRQGTASMKRTDKGSPVRWRLNSTKVLLDDSLEDLGPNARAAVKGAFATWARSDELPAIDFAETHGIKLETKPDGKNTVLFAPITVKGHEHDLAITLTYSDEDSGNIVEADVVINTEYSFRTLTSDGDGYPNDSRHESDDDADENNGGKQLTVSAARASCTAQAQRASCEGNAYDVQNVVTHEVGHFFGLGEDMQDPAATMYYCTSRCETHKRVLTSTDTTVMASLYQNVIEDSPEAAGCGGARLAPRGGLGEAALGLGAALGLLAARRRQRNR
jgi:hypothetical protein